MKDIIILSTMFRPTFLNLRERIYVFGSKSMSNVQNCSRGSPRSDSIKKSTHFYLKQNSWTPWKILLYPQDGKQMKSKKFAANVKTLQQQLAIRSKKTPLQVQSFLWFWEYSQPPWCSRLSGWGSLNSQYKILCTRKES